MQSLVKQLGVMLYLLELIYTTSIIQNPLNRDLSFFTCLLSIHQMLYFISMNFWTFDTLGHNPVPLYLHSDCPRFGHLSDGSCSPMLLCHIPINRGLLVCLLFWNLLTFYPTWSSKTILCSTCPGSEIIYFSTET